jgi:hypothetical protein
MNYTNNNSRNRRPYNVDSDNDSSQMDDSSVTSHGDLPGIDSSSTNSHTGRDNSDNVNNSSSIDMKDGTTGELEQMKLFAAVETARVNRWKFVVIVTILIVGAAVSTLTYRTLLEEQSSDAYNAVSYCYIDHTISHNGVIFCTALSECGYSFPPVVYVKSFQFQLFSNAIADSFTFRVKVIFDTNRALSRSITSSAIEVSVYLPIRPCVIVALVCNGHVIGLTKTNCICKLRTIYRRTTENFLTMPSNHLKRKHTKLVERQSF